jgi:DnaJ-class molecular chaperone
MLSDISPIKLISSEKYNNQVPTNKKLRLEREGESDSDRQTFDLSILHWHKPESNFVRSSSDSKCT